MKTLKLEATNLILGILITLILFLYIAPLSGGVMDLLLVVNLSFSLLILFVALNIESPSRFTTFPTLLLLATLFRLGLNISSTRLILSKAHEKGLNAAGEIIAGFGTFVAGDQALVGLMIFSIILVVHYFVISKGSDRISEVTARFMLDSLPGKQLGVDRELQNRSISEKEARKQKKEIMRESNFYASMDGAMKFVKGDALASVLITAINIVGGLLLGILIYQIPLTQALEIFTKLTIGDGLVSAIPALLNALSAGIIMTRVSGVELPGKEMKDQLFTSPMPLFCTAAVLFLMLFTPLPKVPLVMAVLTMAIMGSLIYRSQKPENKGSHLAREKQHIEELTQLEPMVIEIGYSLIRLIDESRGGQVGKLIMEIRKKTAEELGVIIPPVAIRDNLKLPSKAYRIFIRGSQVTEGTIHRDRFLAINPGQVRAKLPGVEISEPILGLKAFWIQEKDREFAESEGYQILTPAAVLAVHFRQTALEGIDKILTRKEVLSILDRAKKTIPDLVSEAIPDKLTIAKLKSILQELLMEQVPIHDIETILEVSYENYDLSPLAIAEEARSRLMPSVIQKYRSPEGILKVIALSQDAETCMGELTKSRDPQEEEERLARAINEKIADLGPLPLLCRANLRRYLRDILKKHKIKIPVFSPREVGESEIEKSAQIQIDDLFMGEYRQKAG